MCGDVQYLHIYQNIPQGTEHPPTYSRYNKYPYVRTTISRRRSGWQRFLNYGHLTKYFGQSVGRGRGN